jgi:hypothetical protein
VHDPSRAAVASLGWALVALVACGGPRATGPLADAAPAAASVAPAGAAARCPTEKLGFTQATGCTSDGYVELCIPRGDARLESKVRSLSRPARLMPGSSGRVGCSTATETLVVYPTPFHDPSVCTSRHGALTDAAWQELCALASLPEIRRIVPTWFE